MSGSRSGRLKAPGSSCSAIWNLVREEDGYSSIAMALSLLLALSLVFSSAGASWIASRSADVQEVADACALAGQNSVAAYTTIAQVLDASVLSLGLAGVITAGAGLVLSAVPGASTVAAEVMDEAVSILDARADFARTAGEGLSRLEATLPLISIANSAACVAANSTDDIVYTGIAIPFPQGSRSEFPLAAEEVDSSALEQEAERLQELADRVDELSQEADALCYEGWLADCGGPTCLRERASTLAGLSGTANPSYPSPEGWNFGVPLQRARAYYARRIAIEAPIGPGIEALTDSCARLAFYEYAREKVRGGSYREHADGSVEIDLPRLPRNASEVRETSLYTDPRWPCSASELGSTLHSTLACPGATGGPAGSASLAALESGAIGHCEVCRMDVGDLGKTPAASTSIDNGFEYWWRKVCDAADAYEQKKNELARYEDELRDASEDAGSSFEDALSALSAARPKICPPGAWGSVAVAVRGGGTLVPTELTAAFLSGASLPAGAAVSAAVLAPDSSVESGNVIAHLLDGLPVQGAFGAGLAQGVCRLWASALSAYGSGYGELSASFSELLGGFDALTGGSAGSWLQERVGSIIERAGLEPADMRPRKPVLVNSQSVLDKAGYSSFGSVR